MSKLPYRRIATAVRDLKLSPYAGWLLTTITLHINPFTNCLEMSLAQLADAAGMSERSVTRWMKVLEKMHLVTVTRRKKPDSQESLPNRYALTGICFETVVSESQNPVMPESPTPSDTESQKRIKTLDINHDENDSSTEINVPVSMSNAKVPNSTEDNVINSPLSGSTAMTALIDLGVTPVIAQRYVSNQVRVLGWIAYVKRRALVGDPVQNSAAYVVKMLQKQEDAPPQFMDETCPRITTSDEDTVFIQFQESNNDYVQENINIINKEDYCEQCNGSRSRFAVRPRCICNQTNRPSLATRNSKNEPLKPEQIWNNAYNQLRLQLDSYSFETWISACEYVSFEDNTYTISVQNSYAERQLNGRYRRLIDRIVSTVADKDLQVRFVSRVQARQLA